MTWQFWCFFSIVLNLFIIITEANENIPSLIIENIIPKRINPNVLRINIKKTDGTILNQLELKKTKGILANSRTPVIKYLDNIENRDRLIKFYPDYEVMQGIGNFSFYHDIDNKASVVLFSDNDGHYLDGIIGDAFRLHRFPVNYLNDILKRPEQHIIEESSSNVESLKENIWSQLNNEVRNVGAVYPELLIALDYNLTVSVSKIQAIKAQLVYWNAVDMLFASIKSSEIYLNIAAFILPSSKHEFEFLENNPGAKFVDFYDAIDGVENLFYKYRNQIPVDYDIIVAMTRAKLCVTPTTANPIKNCINGFAEAQPDTLNKFDDEGKVVDSSIVLHFDNQVLSFTNAAQKIGYMFTGEFTQKKEIKKCPGIMEEFYRRGKFSLSWSTCSQRKFVDYLQSPKAEGLKNYPKYLLEEPKSQPLTIEPPSEVEFNNLDNWKNIDKNNETSDVIISTKPSVDEVTELTIATEVSLSEISKEVLEINKPNVDLQQEFTTLKTSLAELDDLSITTKPFLPEQIPEINYSDTDLEQESTKSKVFLDNLGTTSSLNVYSTVVPSSQNYVMNDFSTASTSTSMYSSIESSSVSFLDENNKNEYLNFQSTTEKEKINTSVVEKQIDRQKRQYALDSTIGIVDDDKLLIDEGRRGKDFEEEILDHEQGEKVSDEAFIPYEQNNHKVPSDEHEETETFNKFPPTLKPDKTLADLNTLARENTLQFFGRNKRFRSLPVKGESSFNNSNDTETITEAATEQYFGQSDSILNINTSNNYETITEPISEQYSNQNDLLPDLNTSNNNKTTTEPIIEQYSNPHESVLSLKTSTSVPLTVSLLSRMSEVNELVQDNSTAASSVFSTELTSLVESSTSSTRSLSSATESTSSSTQPSCKREKMKLDVSLELNINTNDKNIKTLKKSFHDRSLNQENDNSTDANDKNRVIKNIINYLLENSDK